MKEYKIILTKKMKEDFKNAEYGIINNIYYMNNRLVMVKLFDINNNELGMSFYNVDDIVEINDINFIGVR